MGVAPGTVPCMPERIEAWWARRQFSRAAAVPYAVGTYRDAWAAYPVLIRQYHPELNAGITLTQIPPAADVLLLWECEAGHRFVATPTEQRHRPGRERRRSAWCPECRDLAQPRRIVPAAGVPAQPESPRVRPRAASRRTPPRAVCDKTPDVAAGTPFASACAPRPASAVEARLRASGWEVVRIRTGRLEPLGPHDLQLPSLGRRGVDRLLDALREIRGPLLVDAYLR